MGFIVNKINAPIDEIGNYRLDLNDKLKPEVVNYYTNELNSNKKFMRSDFKLLASIAWSIDLSAMLVGDLAKLIRAEILYKGEINKRRVKYLALHAGGTTDIEVWPESW